MVSGADAGRPRCVTTAVSITSPAGMTNAGKTYTITGSEEHPGLLPRTLAEAFRSVEDARAQAAARGVGDRLAVVVSYLEIYNEQVYDLLSQAAAAAGAAPGGASSAAAAGQPPAAASKAAKAAAAAQAAAALVVREPLAVKDGR